MPIDPNIALGYRGIEVPNPLAGMAQVTQIQNALQQQRMGGIQMQNALREQARQQELESIMSGLSPTAPASEQAAALQKRGFFPQAQSIIQQAATLSKTQREAEDARLKALTSKAELMGRFFSSVTDQPTYEAARQQAIAAGLGTEQEIPTTYDPSIVQRVLNNAMSLKDQIAARQREQEVSARGTSARAAESQAMTARDKFEWEKANPGFTVQDTEQGLMKVDKRTGAMSPLTMGGQPVMSRTTPQVIQGPEGPMVVQPTTGLARPVMQPAPAPGGTATPVGAPLTTGEREWRNAVARGEFDGSFVEWKKQTQPKQFESTVDVERSKSLQREADDVSAAASSAARTLPALEVQAKILDSGFKTGWGTQAQQAASRVLAVLGVKDAEKFSTKAELFLSQTQSAVNDALAKQKGAQSDSDAKRASQIYTNLGNTPESNQFLVKMATAVARRDIEKKTFYDDWFKANKSYEGADAAWQKGPGAQSIFDMPEMRQYQLSSATPRAGGGQLVGGRSAASPAAAIPKPALSAADQQALDWATANPNDPRSAQIKQHLGQ